MGEVLSPYQLQAEVRRLNGKLAKIRMVSIGVGGFAGLFLLSFMLQSRGSAERLRAEGRREMAVACGLSRDTVHQQGLPPEITQALGQVVDKEESFMAQMREYRRQQEVQRAKEAAERLKANSTPGKSQ